MTDPSPEAMNGATQPASARSPEFVATISAAIALGVLIVSLGVLFFSMVSTVDARFASPDTRLAQLHAGTAAECRAFQTSMDTFRKEVLRLAAERLA